MVSNPARLTHMLTVSFLSSEFSAENKTRGNGEMARNWSTGTCLLNKRASNGVPWVRFPLFPRDSRYSLS